MNTESKNPQQNSRKQFNNILKRSYNIIKWDLFQECKDGSVSTNQSIPTNQSTEYRKFPIYEP